MIVVIILCLTLFEPASAQMHDDRYGVGHTNCSYANSVGPSYVSIPGVPMVNSSFNITLAECEINGYGSTEKEIELSYLPSYGSSMVHNVSFEVQSEHFDSWNPSTHPKLKLILNGEQKITLKILLSPTREVNWLDDPPSLITGMFYARTTSVDGQPTRFSSQGNMFAHSWETLACNGPICYSSGTKNVITNTGVDHEEEKIEVIVSMNESGTDFRNIGIKNWRDGGHYQIHTTQPIDAFVFRKGDIMIGKENSLKKRIELRPNEFDNTNISSWKSLENGTSIQIENLIIEARIDSLNEQIGSSKIYIDVEAYYAPDPNDIKKEDSSLPGFSNSLAILSILCSAMFYRRNGPETVKSR